MVEERDTTAAATAVVVRDDTQEAHVPVIGAVSEDKTDGAIEMEKDAAVHQPRTEIDDEVDPEERIRSHGEDEGGEVSKRERSRKLVSEERKRIGNKNSRKRRGGIGKRRKREIKDHQFKM